MEQKTVLEWIQTIPNELTKKRALIAFEKFPLRVYHRGYSFRNAVCFGFDWDLSDEKSEFWVKVAKWARDVDELNEPGKETSRAEIKAVYDRCPVFEDDLPNERIK